MTGTARTSDALLVVAVQRHDQEALAELYRRHGGSVFQIALRVLAVRGLAEEVVQDIFIRMWQRPERFDPARGSLRSFLLAQAHGRAIDIVRSETSRRRREKGDADAVKVAYVLEGRGRRLRHRPRNPKGGRNPRRARTGGNQLGLLRRPLLRRCRVPLGVPEGTVKSRIRSGLARLRRAMVEAGIDPFMANSVIA